MNDTERRGGTARAAHLRDLPVFLRAPRAAGLWLVGVLIPVATVAGFVLSYRGLFDWARYHGWPLYLAPLFPLLIDLLIIAGEVVLFVAAIDGKTPRRVRAFAWAIVVAFTALSVVGNVDHAATSDPLTRGGWGLPPVVLAIALGFGLGELKRQAAKYRTGTEHEPAEQLLPAEFTDKVSAAEVAYRRSVAGGNPFKPYALATRFDIPRPVAAGIVERVSAELGQGGAGIVPVLAAQDVPAGAPPEAPPAPAGARLPSPGLAAAAANGKVTHG